LQVNHIFHNPTYRKVKIRKKVKQNNDTNIYIHGKYYERPPIKYLKVNK
jgi:hypothetical protein